MLKKFIVILVLLFLVVAGLQLLGGRDFSQISIAWEKYQYKGNLVSFGEDVATIFAGDKIQQGGLATSRMAERLIYRWTDEFGVQHNSERAPKNQDYQVIRMGDTIDVQKSMDEEEIKKALDN